MPSRTISSRNTSRTDGSLNLDVQRKRAKTLLKQLRAGQAPEALRQLQQLGLPGPDYQLADAQWLTARELGFASWPKLKAHSDAIAFAARHPSFAADGEDAVVHWRCGNDIEHSLRIAGFKGAFRMLADPLVMGPVCERPADVFQEQRSQYIHQAFGIPLADTRRRTATEYAALETIDSHSRLVLWCEADAYDQLFLVCLLAHLKQMPQRLELIETRQVPGVERFIGIGQLAPDVLAWLWPQRRVLDESAWLLARQAWSAYCSADPQAWAALAHRPTPALPLLAPALLRQLHELPHLRDGLSLSERLLLSIVAEQGQITAGRAYAELMLKREPLPYLTDLMVHVLLRPLIDAPTPLLLEDQGEPWAQRNLRLTALGQRVLAGEAYWLDEGAPERWVGGVHLLSGVGHWAVDEAGWPRWRA